MYLEECVEAHSKSFLNPTKAREIFHQRAIVSISLLESKELAVSGFESIQRDVIRNSKGSMLDSCEHLLGMIDQIKNRGKQKCYLLALMQTVGTLTAEPNQENYSIRNDCFSSILKIVNKKFKNIKKKIPEKFIESYVTSYKDIAKKKQQLILLLILENPDFLPFALDKISSWYGTTYLIIKFIPDLIELKFHKKDLTLCKSYIFGEIEDLLLRTLQICVKTEIHSKNESSTTNQNDEKTYEDLELKEVKNFLCDVVTKLVNIGNVSIPEKVQSHLEKVVTAIVDELKENYKKEVSFSNFLKILLNRDVEESVRQHIKILLGRMNNPKLSYKSELEEIWKKVNEYIKLANQCHKYDISI